MTTLAPTSPLLRRAPWPLWLGLLVALTAVAALRPGLAGVRDYKATYTLDDEGREQVNTTPFALILGELRVTTADLLWIKTERYMHRGVSFAPHISAAELASTGAAAPAAGDAHAAHQADGEHDPVHAKPGDKGLDDAGHPRALVPTAEADYRGFIGTIQRHVQPWQPPTAPDVHQPGDELIPWYRVLTLSNPHHTRGYMTGAWWLMKQQQSDPGSVGQALGFIDEGIRNNPKSFQLELMRGRILLEQNRIHDAIAAFRKSATLALAVRPAGGKEREPDWTYWEEEDFSSAVHYVPALSYMKLHDPAVTRAALAWAERLLPGDRRLARIREEFEKDPTAKNLKQDLEE